MPVEAHTAQQPSWNPVQLWRNFAGWWRVESPKPTTEDEKPVELRPVLSKLLQLCAPDVGLLVMATIFMVMALSCAMVMACYVREHALLGFCLTWAKSRRGRSPPLACTSSLSSVAEQYGT